jgi:hypothetical protein
MFLLKIIELSNRWNNPNRNRDRYRNRKSASFRARGKPSAYGVDSDPDGGFDPEKKIHPA